MEKNLFASDQVWNKLSETDPYWGVLSMEKFRGSLDARTRMEFFETGHNGVQHMMFKAKLAGWKGENKVAIDFGCGVGRLSHSLAHDFDIVYSVDISAKMLKICTANCEDFGQTNITPVLSDDTLSGLDGVQADFVLSVITFQHIRPERGMKILNILLSKLKIGGAAALFILIGGSGQTFMNEITPDVVDENPERFIEMNIYDIHELMILFQLYSAEVTLNFVPTGSQMGANVFLIRDR